MTRYISVFFLIILISPISSAFARPAEPQPTNAMKWHAPMTVKEAKEAMGFADMAGYRLSNGSTFRFTIIDAGFAGLDAWLEKHPEWQKKIEYVSLRKDGRHGKAHHGFDVLRVATNVIGNVELILIETGDYLNDFKEILETMKRKRSYFGTMSLGMNLYLGGAPAEKVHSDFKLLDQYQLTLLTSSGNERDQSHFFRYVDADGDRVLEFSDKPWGEKKVLIESNPIIVTKGKSVSLSLGWQEWGDVKSTFEIQLINRKQEIVAKTTSKLTKQAAVNLDYMPEESEPLWIRVLDKTPDHPAEKQFLGLFVFGANTSKGLFNGLESLVVQAQFDSPFLIPVGGFAKEKSTGDIVPSTFSSLGHMDSGKLSPLVMGPGQITMEDGEVLNGTSFATPFIAALYSMFADYNVKNIIEQTSNHEKWSLNIAAASRSQYGIPNAAEIFNNGCRVGNKVKNLRHNITDEALVFEFDFTRGCMEGLDYYLHAYMKDERTGQSFSVKGSKQPLRGWVKKHSRNRQIINEPMRIEIPLKQIPRNAYGVPAVMDLRISTLAQWEPVSINTMQKLNGKERLQPFRYNLTLPEPEPYPDEVQGIDAAKLAVTSINSGAYFDAVDLASRALKDESLSEKNVALMRTVREKAAIGGGFPKDMSQFYLEDAKRLSGDAKAEALAGATIIAQAQKRHQDASDLFLKCQDAVADTSSKTLTRCVLGYILAQDFLDKGSAALADMKARWGEQALADLAKQMNVPAIILSARVKQRSYQQAYADSLTLAQKEGGAAAVNSGYYWGLISAVSGKMERAKTSFNVAKSYPRVFTPESLASRMWSGDVPLDKGVLENVVVAKVSVEKTPQKEQPKTAEVVESAAQSEPAAKPATNPTELKHQVGTTFKECNACPEMVVLPAGHFRMGDIAGIDGRSAVDSTGKLVKPSLPVHDVTINAPFAMGVFEVSVAEWSVCVHNPFQIPYWQFQCEMPKYRAKGTPIGKDADDYPVSGVAYSAISHYIEWLNARLGLTDKPDAYRLPSEAEWEYAARAGSEAAWSCGSDPACLADHAVSRSKVVRKRGTKRPNAFGLYDMLGNVSEWTQDCYQTSYAGVPTDGSAYVVKDCKEKVIRGGDFSSQSPSTSLRDWMQWYNDNPYVGFRLVKPLIAGQ